MGKQCKIVFRRTPISVEVVELIDRRIAIHRRTRKCLVGPYDLDSFILENAMRAADAIALNLPYLPERCLLVRGIKPLARTKCRCRRRGTPPRRDANCGSQWRFLLLRACVPPRILGGVDVWLIDGLLTQQIYRNGCIVILDGPNHYRLADPVMYRKHSGAPRRGAE
jgi:hypothetical protein